ncbi:52 kDa repressor of the inhibitor of the protein kinase-like [Schistocerca gregaria]|uniref:52 kDa repressor of the inhibitor of the protein kinase-like n=1 Tax=Schistocerca gregaria TaxID=7010 RepID=UPI00211F1F48|nr:52 kDa repressor of the inhibitor of the protein kinase-like [Schistocerca gregaria]
MKTTNESGGVEEDTVYDEVSQENGESNATITIKNSSSCADGENKDKASTSAGFKCIDEKVKGALCKFCVLFCPLIMHGSHHSAFISCPFTNFKNFHECAKMHMNSKWHKDAIEKLNNFISGVTNKTKGVEELANENLAKLVQTDRAKLKSNVSCILFCALHDLPLRRKTNSTVVFDDLLQFRVQSGDVTLQKYFEGAPKNATYVSHRTQNDSIDVCAEVLRNDLINTINNSESFSVLADKTMDIAGTEQIPLSAGYFDHATNVVREDFLGFTPLARLDVQHISNTIISTLSAWGLNLDKMVGQGYDGCSTMASKISGVQRIISEKYPKAHFYRCASHRLNLVVNDLITLPEVRHAIGTIKERISFFWGSTQRKFLVGNLQKLCETRWSEKHESIRKFNDKFLKIVEALAILHKEGDRETRQKAWQLYCTLTSPTFIVTLKVLAKYSAKLEPVTNILQSENINLLEVSEHIQRTVKMLLDDRENVEDEFVMIMKSAESNYSALGIDVTVQSLQEGVSEDSKASFEIFCLHPKTWITIWKRDKVTEGDIAELSLTHLLDKAKFLPAVASALKIALSLLATTCSAERSFSTLRSIKTWLRTTMEDNRISCLCMVSVHCDKIKSEEESFIEKVVVEIIVYI